MLNWQISPLMHWALELHAMGGGGGGGVGGSDSTVRRKYPLPLTEWCGMWTLPLTVLYSTAAVCEPALSKAARHAVQTQSTIGPTVGVAGIRQSHLLGAVNHDAEHRVDIRHSVLHSRDVGYSRCRNVP